LKPHPTPGRYSAWRRETTGLPLKRLCFTGPIGGTHPDGESKPAVTVVNLCLYRALAKAGVTPVAVCGHAWGSNAPFTPRGC